MKKPIITIAGLAGSGKSSTAKRLATDLNYQRYSAGDFMRAMAAEKNISLLELQKIAEADHSIDQEIDERSAHLSEEDNIIVDGRLAWYFIPNSFKVFLHLPIEIAGKRIWQDLQENPDRTGESFHNVNEVIAGIRNRVASNKKRYHDLYNIDFQDLKNFDLIIDTSTTNLEQTVDQIKQSYKSWLSN